MVEPVPELIPLGRQVSPVLVVRRHLDRHLLGHLEAEGLQAGDLLRVVRQQADRRQPELGQDLVADPPLPLVGGEAEREIRIDRVEPSSCSSYAFSLLSRPMPRPSCAM